MPGFTGLHHRIMDRMQKHLGKPVLRVVLPTTVRLPCRRCGRPFESCPPRYARICSRGVCKKLHVPRPTSHSTGAVGFWTDGAYPAGPAGPGASWAVSCQHPECLTVFTTTHKNRVYCPAHSRMSAKRARDRIKEL
jgi:hypothetical protein